MTESLWTFPKPDDDEYVREWKIGNSAVLDAVRKDLSKAKGFDLFDVAETDDQRLSELMGIIVKAMSFSAYKQAMDRAEARGDGEFDRKWFEMLSGWFVPQSVKFGDKVLYPLRRDYAQD